MAGPAVVWSAGGQAQQVLSDLPQSYQLFRSPRIRGGPPISLCPANAHGTAMSTMPYLLGLDWQPFTDLKLLDDRKAVLRTVKKSIKEGVLRGPQGDPAAMESRRVRLDQEIGELERQLHDFKVHPDYREIEEQATALTAELRKKRNKAFAAERKKPRPLKSGVRF